MGQLSPGGRGEVSSLEQEARQYLTARGEAATHYHHITITSVLIRASILVKPETNLRKVLSFAITDFVYWVIACLA